MKEKNNVMETLLEQIDTHQPKVGDVVEATVLKVDKTTIYLDLKAQTEGKMHINEYSNDPKIESFKGLVKKGERIKAVVHKISDDPALILLSRKPLLVAKDQNEIVELCQNQKLVKGKIKQFNKGGALVQYKGYEIFIPFANLDFEIAQNQEQSIGLEIEFYIQEANFMRRLPKIIGTRRPIYEAEREAKNKEQAENEENEIMGIKEGDILDGEIVAVKQYIAIVKFNYVTGLLRISQISHNRITSVEDVLKVGDKVKVKVMKKQDRKLDLSMKALIPTPYDQFKKDHKKGDTIKGKIIQKMPYGFFLQIGESLRGLLHVSEFAWDPKDTFGTQSKIGDEVEIKLIDLVDEKGQVVLSRKALFDNPWKNVELKKGQNVELIIESFESDRVIVSSCGVTAYVRNDEMDTQDEPSKVYQVGEKLNAKVKYVNKFSWILELSVKRYNDEKLEQELLDATKAELERSKKATTKK